jgi:hypothetical protein
MSLQPFSPRQTSGAFLLEVARRLAEAGDEDQRRRCEMAFDVHIKQWSDAALDKAFFWLALMSSLCALVWPALLATLQALEGLSIVTSAITQTMATAVAAFFVALYLHCKARQTAAETLPRAIAFGALPTDGLAGLASEELRRVDQGAGFRAQAEKAET